jgi:hypothetical protein
MKSNTYFILTKYHSDCQVKDDKTGWLGYTYGEKFVERFSEET